VSSGEQAPDQLFSSELNSTRKVEKNKPTKYNVGFAIERTCVRLPVGSLSNGYYLDE